MSLTQTVKKAGFRIITKIATDRIGILHIVIIERDKKRTQRKARKYDEALEACAIARGIATRDSDNV